MLYFTGSVYKKVRYHQYDSSDFKNKLTSKQNMGVLGPVIGGEAGDIIKVAVLVYLFQNSSHQTEHMVI